VLNDFIEIEKFQHDVLGDIEVARPNMAKAASKNKLHLAKELTISKDGDLKIKLRDQDHALNQLARAAGVFEKDNVVHLPPEITALLKLDAEGITSRANAYDSMEEWEQYGCTAKPEREISESD